VNLRPSPLPLAAAIALTIALSLSVFGPAAAAPEGQVTFAVHVSLAPTWFDPVETPGVITPFMTPYVLFAVRGPEAEGAVTDVLRSGDTPR
jgi:hypothetical protein